MKINTIFPENLNGLIFHVAMPTSWVSLIGYNYFIWTRQVNGETSLYALFVVFLRIIMTPLTKNLTNELSNQWNNMNFMFIDVYYFHSCSRLFVPPGILPTVVVNPLKTCLGVQEGQNTGGVFYNN